jgi:hypothetical protein
VIFPGGFGQRRTLLTRLRAWRPRRSRPEQATTALGIAHHQGMIEALRVATSEGRARVIAVDE